MAAKKKKYKLSILDIGRSNDIGKELNNMGLNIINNDKNNINKSIDLEPEKEFIFTDKDVPSVNNGEKSDKNTDIDNGSSINNI